MDVFDEPVLLLTGPEPDGVHLLAHGGMEQGRHAFTLDHGTAVALQNLLVRVYIVVDVPA